MKKCAKRVVLKQSGDSSRARPKSAYDVYQLLKHEYASKRDIDLIFLAPRYENLSTSLHNVKVDDGTLRIKTKRFTEVEDIMAHHCFLIHDEDTISIRNYPCFCAQCSRIVSRFSLVDGPVSQNGIVIFGPGSTPGCERSKITVRYVDSDEDSEEVDENFAWSRDIVVKIEGKRKAELVSRSHSISNDIAIGVWFAAMPVPGRKPHKFDTTPRFWLGRVVAATRQKYKELIPDSTRPWIVYTYSTKPKGRAKKYMNLKNGDFAFACEWYEETNGNGVFCIDSNVPKGILSSRNLLLVGFSVIDHGNGTWGLTPAIRAEILRYQNGYYAFG